MQKYYELLRKYWLDFFIYSYILFIIYSTIVPFNFIDSMDTLQKNLADADLMPFLSRNRMIPRSDVVANVLFFIPLGIFMALNKILTYYRRFSLKDWAEIFLTGFFTSLLVEMLQLFTYDRHTSVTDLLTNTLGTLLGAGFMMIIYLKFHDRIKSVLYFLFVPKPEMSFAAVFFSFIFLSYSVPFTFQPSLSTVKHTMNIFINNLFSPGEFLNALPVSILLFSTFGYFLLNGIFRYFDEKINRTILYLILSGLFLLPFLLELYQLLIPIRNHSVGDILAAECGLFLGLLIFMVQHRFGKNSKEKVGNHEYYFFQYLKFFKILSWIYIFYIIIFFFRENTAASFVETFRNLFVQGGKQHMAMIRYKRLEFLIRFAKEVFTFLPAGFILSLFLLQLRRQFSWMYLVTGSFILLFIGFYMIFLMKTSTDWYLFIHLIAIITGLWMGDFFRKVFNYMLKIT